MDQNEDTDILGKLGILESKLESPHKKYPRPKDVRVKRRAATAVQLQSITDSESDDCLFDQQRLNGHRPTRPLKRRSRRALDSEAPNNTRLYSSNWQLFSVFCALTFIGFSLTNQYFTVSRILQGVDSTQIMSYLIKFSIIHAFGLLFGTIFAGLLFVRFNAFILFLALMLASFGLTVVVPVKAISNLAYFICVSQGFIFAAIQRGGLITPSLFSNSQRTLFLIFMGMALGMSLNSWISPHPEANNYNATKMVILPSHTHMKREVPVASMNSTVSAANPPMIQNSPLVGNTTSSSRNSTSKTPQESQDAAQSLVFKTKTEENAFRRKEAEQRKKGELQQQEPTDTVADTTTVPIVTTTTVAATTTQLPTTTQTTTTEIPSTTTLLITTTLLVTVAPTTVEEPKAVTLNVAESPAILSSSNRLISDLLSSALILPLVLGFCFCCFDYSIRSNAQTKELASAISTEPIASRFLSLFIWTAHFSLLSILESFLVFYGDKFPSVVLHSTVPLQTWFWLSIAVVRLLFVARPSLSLSTAIVHVFYCLSLVACLVLHFILSQSSAFTMARIILMGLVSANLPLLLYAWLSSSPILQPKSLGISWRFMFSAALGHAIGPFAFYTWVPESDRLSTIFQLGLILLIVSYVLFVLLSTNLQRSNRKQQITQLSGALNGKTPKQQNTSATSSKTTIKGQQYRSLLGNGLGSSSDEIDFEMESLPENRSAGETSESEVDLV